MSNQIAKLPAKNFERKKNLGLRDAVIITADESSCAVMHAIITILKALIALSN